MTRFSSILLGVALMMLSSAPAASAQETAAPAPLNPEWNSSYKIKPEQLEIVKQLVANMVCIPGGKVVVGADELEPGADISEKPKHHVNLSTYYIGKYEVTQREWKALMKNNPSAVKGDDLPVTNVTYQDCRRFVDKLCKLTGLPFRLPTEAEWDNAATGNGSNKGYFWAGSNNPAKVGWVATNSGGTVHPVGQKIPNELGIYDMTGNVTEWCYDWYDNMYYNDTKDATNPAGPKTPEGPTIGFLRTVRGGAFDHVPVVCRNHTRGAADPDEPSPSRGLRLAVGDGVPPMGKW